MIAGRLFLIFIFILIFILFNTKMFISFYFKDSSFECSIINKSKTFNDILHYSLDYYTKPIYIFIILLILKVVGLEFLFNLFCLVGLNLYMILGVRLDEFSMIDVGISIIKFIFFLLIYYFIQKLNFENKEFRKLEEFFKVISFSLSWAFISIISSELLDLLIFSVQG